MELATARRGGRGGHPPQDFTGRQIGRLRVLGPAPRPEGGQAGSYWLAECVCGTVRPIHGGSLRGARVQSCGCLRRERGVALGRARLGCVRVVPPGPAPAPFPAIPPVDFIAGLGGFRAEPYLPGPQAVPAIGYGSWSYPSGRLVSMTDPPCTEAQARAWLARELVPVQAAVRRLVRVDLHPGQWAALVSFAHSAGVAALEGSMLLRRVNGGAMTLAANQFRRWNRRGGKSCPRLTARRRAEAAAFRGELPNVAAPAKA